MNETVPLLHGFHNWWRHVDDSSLVRVLNSAPRLYVRSQHSSIRFNWVHGICIGNIDSVPEKSLAVLLLWLRLHRLEQTALCVCFLLKETVEAIVVLQSNFSFRP